MNNIGLPEPLGKNKKLPKLPNQKSSIYQLTRRECRQWYRSVCQELYPKHWVEMMKEYGQAVANEPDGTDGVQMQLSSLLSYYAWWY